MPLTGPIPEGHAFFCPHCGALYAVTHSRPRSKSESERESNIAKCVVCGKIMGQWDSTDVRVFKLVHRSEDA
jgi:RNase P subunit RPR2